MNWPGQLRLLGGLCMWSGESQNERRGRASFVF